MLTALRFVVVTPEDCGEIGAGKFSTYARDLERIDDFRTVSSRSPTALVTTAAHCLSFQDTRESEAHRGEAERSGSDDLGGEYW